MREAGSNGADKLKSSRLRTRALRLAAVLLGIGLVIGAGPVRADDDEDADDRTFERKIMDNLMSGLGAKRIEDGGIDYRERSPLVVPSKIELPPPQEVEEGRVEDFWRWAVARWRPENLPAPRTRRAP